MWRYTLTTVTLITSSHIKHMHEIMRTPSNLTVLPLQPKAIKSTSYELLSISLSSHVCLKERLVAMVTLGNETHNLSRYLACDGAYGTYDSSVTKTNGNDVKWNFLEQKCSSVQKIWTSSLLMQKSTWNIKKALQFTLILLNGHFNSV